MTHRRDKVTVVEVVNVSLAYSSKSDNTRRKKKAQSRLFESILAIVWGRLRCNGRKYSGFIDS